MKLFRPEATDFASRNRKLGEAILDSSKVTNVFVALICAIAVTLVVLLFTIGITKREHVSGTLLPNKGLIRITPYSSGVIAKIAVSENKRVSKGDELFALSNEHFGSDGDAVLREIESLGGRESSLQNDLSTLTRRQEDERKMLDGQLALQIVQYSQLSSEIDIQSRRVQLADGAYNKYKNLYAQRFVSDLQFQSQTGDLLDQQAKLSSLQRSANQMKSDIDKEKAYLHSAPLRFEAEKAEITRQILALQAELAEKNASRRTSLTSPVSGTVVGVQAQVGQRLKDGEVIASIIPDGSDLYAYFYAPSSAVGFVKVGQDVLLRYAAYPYQKFGQYHGTVADISRAAMHSGSDGKDAQPLEQLYRITVKPSDQYVLAYGRKEELLPDMRVDANIITDRRTIIEWIFEPLISVRGTL